MFGETGEFALSRRKKRAKELEVSNGMEKKKEKGKGSIRGKREVNLRSFAQEPKDIF